MAVDDLLSPCGRLVRRYDHDRYLTALFAPPDRREALFALYAFNTEVAKTREAVSEPLLGQIRLQWWRESLDGIAAATPRRHEVVEPLAEAIDRFGLDRALLDQVIDARERDLELDARPFADLDELEAYGRATNGPLHRLALQVLGVGAEPAHAAAEEVGAAWALTGLARAVPFHARHKRLYLPRTLIEAEGAEVGDVFEMRSPPGLHAAVRRVAERARARLRDARRRRGV
ncbi:MAG: squalene/phytoene synthase family protein, partial [Alphaproteobacteria bacterium]|nr:squalene/phytoene synthase family protein [Alphaproteobacteria bacterium]